MVYSFMIWYTGLKAYNMVNHDGPYILSLGRAIDYENDAIATTKVLLNETTKVHYEVIDNLFTRYDYEESKKYITLTYDQVTNYKDESGAVISETEPF